LTFVAIIYYKILKINYKLIIKNRDSPGYLIKYNFIIVFKHIVEREEGKMEKEKKAYEKPLVTVQKKVDDTTWGQEPPMGREPFLSA
jgi:hypothetical protein